MGIGMHYLKELKDLFLFLKTTVIKSCIFIVLPRFYRHFVVYFFVFNLSPYVNKSYQNSEEDIY